MPATHPIDGSLPAWEDLEEAADWRALLLGNGLSINAWPKFDYGSLFEQAKLGDEHCRLDPLDLALFEQFETENFELVLGNLDTAIRTTTTLGHDAGALMERYESIRHSLGCAVRSVHITRSETPDITLETIKLVMEQHDVIFTTSYDMLAYWAMGFYEDFGRLVDLFWSDSPNGRCGFNPEHTDVWDGCAPVYFLHGALHLIAHGNGETRKLLRTQEATVLDQFGQPIEGDPHARSLLVSEGSSRDKLRAIQTNAYLTYALKQLTGCELPLVVFGSSLAEHDMHLIDAINKQPDRPVAVSMMPEGKMRVRALQGEIRSRLATHKLHFYNAASHPLGDQDLICRPAVSPSRA
jgi:Domain of unknown function (DUF4917)